MTESLPLAGKVIAIVGTGSDFDRALAVACAEAGADLALAAATTAREHDYGMNSIANEIWAIGREHFVLVLESPDDAQQFVAAARERLGRCDVLVAASRIVADVPVVSPASTPAATLARIAAAIARGHMPRRATPHSPLPPQRERGRG